MAFRALVWLAAAALLAPAVADTLQWTGAAKDKLWDNAQNWNPSRVPTARDTVQLPEQAVVNIATPNGAAAYAVFLKDGTYLSIFGSNFSIGDGGLWTTGFAALRIDAGAGALSVSGPAWINGSTAAWWQSGSLMGTFIIGPTASFNATGTAWLSCTGGALNVLGTLGIIGGGIFNSTCPIYNQGRVIVSSPSSSQTTLYEAHVFNSPGAMFSIEGGNPVSINLLESNETAISANVNWLPSGWGRLNNTMLTGLIHVQGQADVLLRNTSGGGAIKAENTVPVRLVDGAILGDITLQAGQINCVSGDFAAAHITVSAGSTLDTAKECSSNIKLLDVNQPFVVQGDGDLRVHMANFNQLITISGSLTILELLSVYSQSVLLNLNGSLNIAETATMLSTCVGAACAFPQVWGTQTVAPGDLNVHGTYSLNGTSPGFTVIMNGLSIPTPLNVSLDSTMSKLNLQNLKCSIPVIHLGWNATFAGASLMLDYKSLTGPKPGAKIAITTNGAYDECLSPCPGKPAPSSPYGVFTATTAGTNY